MTDENQLIKSGRTIDEIVNKTASIVGIIRMPDLNQNYEKINYFSTILSNVISFSIKDSIESYYRTATVILSDRLGTRSSMPLTGNEIISIKYKNDIYSFENNIPAKVIHFRVFDIEEVEDVKEQNSNAGATLIKIELVEFPVFDMFSYTQVYKTYEKEIGISDYLKEMLNGVPNLSKHYELDIDDSRSDLKMQFWSPNWTVTKNMEYLKNFLLDEKSRGFWYLNTSDATKEGKKPILKCNSILSFLENKNYRNYSSLKTDNYYRPPNKIDTSENSIDKSVKDFADDRQYAPLDYIFNRKIKWGNAMKYVSGLFGKTFAHYSFENGSQYNSLDYASFLKDYKSLGKYNPVALSAQNKNQWSYFDYLPHNNPAIVEAYNLNTFYFKQFKQLTMEIKTPLNQTRANGEIANIIIPAPKSSGEMVDYMMSGKWLTWEVNDIILANGTSYSKVTLCRDSFWLVDNKDKYLQEMNSYENSNLGGIL